MHGRNAKSLGKCRGPRFFLKDVASERPAMNRVRSGEGPQTVVIDRSEFKSKDDKELEWSKISTFSVTIVDLKNKLPVNLASEDEKKILQRIELVNSEN